MNAPSWVWFLVVLILIVVLLLLVGHPIHVG